ncbi:hypothetical protein [uncultured Paraglaciecola sp.]|uniref:hypothetical protein n=1 Tax=uncultured Paraglaciecola sp. TaxID=1765024 RepID=UPI00262242C6|nr:hypothetical protein [uncultured Paraglaciecola sp.]
MPNYNDYTPEALPLNIARQNSDQLSAEFMEWLPDNLHIYLAFEKEATAIFNSGRSHYSARTIVEFLRHHTAIAEKPQCDWKINDHSVPYLARLFDMCNPSMAGLFNYRILTKKKASEL